ncbi:MAG: DUF2294 domain-containing protein [Elainellaceae cyanobacterium]
MATSIEQRQAEDIISENVKRMYRDHVGHEPGLVTCQIFDDKLVLLIEGAITPAEKLLLQVNQRQLVDQVRSLLDVAIQPYLKSILEHIIDVPVVDLMVNTTVDTERTGSIAILAEKPNVQEILTHRYTGHTGTQGR